MSDAGQVAELDGARSALVGVGTDGGADFGADVEEGVGERAGDGDGVGADGLEEAVAVFTRVRPRLFGIAYRMLSSVTEAEDLVQEVWVRWQTCDRKAVRDPAAFLGTTAIRLAINELRWARVRREKYVGPWLPEPVETSADPYLGAERGDALQFAALLLMERRTPNERAAYVLREAFDYSYPEIADVLGPTGAAVPQSVSRARKHMASERPISAPAAAQRELLTKFIAAARDGDMAALEQLFAADVASVSDGNGNGNGRARVGHCPVVGALRVARFLKAISSRFWHGAEVLWVTTNGQTCALLRYDGALWGMITVRVSGEHIDQVLWMFNPEKITARSVPPGLVLDGGFAEVTKASP